MRPFLLVLAGSDANATNTLAQTLAEALGPLRCVVANADAFTLEHPREAAAGSTPPLLSSPASLDQRALRRALRRLRAGRRVEWPIVDPTTQQKHPECHPLSPRPLLLLKGCWAIAVAGDLADATVYLDAATQRPLPPGLHEQKNQATLILSPAATLAEKFAQVRALLPPVLSETLAFPGHEKEKPALSAELQTLAHRMGREALVRRLALQSSHWAGLLHQGEGLLAVERVAPVDALLEGLLQITGLRNVGLQGAQDLRIEQHTIETPTLPHDLQGYRILQLSDLHLDLETGVLERLLAVLPGLNYDLAVITGDFRNSTRGDFAKCLRETQRVLEVLRPPRFGILGNHDFIEMVPYLEKAGLPILLNEAVTLAVGQARLYLAGIDDPHFYRTHDWERVVEENSPPETFRILLSHSPETWAEAMPHFDLQLSGHTHGGQICLPGGIPIIRNGRCPAALLAGAWQRGTLRGYTSRGTGCCGVAARFFCPPEITLHTLTRGQAKGGDASD